MLQLLFYSIPQSLEANWRSGHYTLTRVQTGNIVMCLQFDDNKLVTGHGVPHYAIMVGSCWCGFKSVCSESVRSVMRKEECLFWLQRVLNNVLQLLRG